MDARWRATAHGSPAAEAPPPVAVAPAAEAAPAVEAMPLAEQEPVAEAPLPAAGAGARGPGPIPGDPTTLFGRTDPSDTQAQLVAYAERAYRPLRPGEFYSPGFLTEGKKLAYGEVLGDVVPPQIANLQSPTTASQFSRIGIIPPKDAAYQVGDSLMIAERITGYSKYGDVIWPTGMARVIEVGPKQTTAVILNQQGAISNGPKDIYSSRLFENNGLEYWITDVVGM